MLATDTLMVADILRERFDPCVELLAIDAELTAIEQRYGVGASPGLVTARAWHQRVCLTLLMQFCASRPGADTTTTVH